MPKPPNKSSRTKNNHESSLKKGIQIEVELDNLEELMKLMKVIVGDFYALRQNPKKKWKTKDFQKLIDIIQTCEKFEFTAKQMGLAPWEKRMTSLLSSLYHLNKFQKTPTILNIDNIHEEITILDQDLKELYIFKHENAIRPRSVSSTNIIFILEDDTLYADTVALQLQNLGFDVQCCGTIEKIRALSRHVHPDLVLIDLNLREGKLAGLEYLIEIGKEIPALVMSARQDIEARLESIRAGAKDYITKPIDMDHLHLTICKHLELNYQKPPKTLIIDDDEFTALTYSKFLKKYNLDVRILTDASKTLEEIENYKPDLIFMDIQMPYASGYEVANVIHQTYGKENSPEIVYMTGTLKGSEKDYDHDNLEKSGILLKPLRPTQMVNIIDKTIRRKMLHS